MRKVLWTVAGVCAAAAGFLVWQRRSQPVDMLARQLQDAWQDHHTRS